MNNDRLILESKIAQQLGARLSGGRYMIGGEDVTQGINWMFDLINAEQRQMIHPVVEAWADARLPSARDKRQQIKRLMPELAHRLDNLINTHDELKHG